MSAYEGTRNLLHTNRFPRFEGLRKQRQNSTARRSGQRPLQGSMDRTYRLRRVVCRGRRRGGRLGMVALRGAHRTAECVLLAALPRQQGVPAPVVSSSEAALPERNSSQLVSAEAALGRISPKGALSRLASLSKAGTCQSCEGRVAAAGGLRAPRRSPCASCP